MSDRPNVIVCLCDQLRAFEVGCYGNEIIRTPHIDCLAREGVRFDLAISNNPVCMPARSALLTGQYSRTCMGYLTNYAAGGELPELPRPDPRWAARHHPRRGLPSPGLPNRALRR